MENKHKVFGETKYLLAFIPILCLSFTFINGQKKINPEARAQIDHKNGIKVIANPNEPALGEKNLVFVSEKIIDKEFQFIEIDLDNDNNLFILDTPQKKIFKFNHAGILEQTIGCNKFEYPLKIFIDSDSQIYVSDEKTLHLFNNKGTYLDSIEFPYEIHNFFVTKKQRIIISTSYYKSENLIFELSLFDLKGNHIKTIFEHSESDPDRSLMKYTSRYHPKLIFSHSKDMSVFGFSSDYTLYVLDQNGEISYIIKKTEQANILTEKQKNEIKKEEPTVSIPKYKPFFLEIHIDNEGNIYVDKWENGNRTFEVFNNEGFYIYDIKVPLIPIFKINNQSMYCGKFIKNTHFVNLIERKFRLEAIK